MAAGGLIKSFEVWDALRAAGTGDWILTPFVPHEPPIGKICVPITRGAHHSLLVVDGSKHQFALLSSTFAKPNLFHWHGCYDATPRNVPKQINACDCGAYVVCYGNIIANWQYIPRRMLKNDVAKEDIHNVRSEMAVLKNIK